VTKSAVPYYEAFGSNINEDDDSDKALIKGSFFSSGILTVWHF
jgi:hypothetical protein